MTKFGKAKKSDCPVCQTELSGFDNFQSQTEEVAKLEDLKIQCVLKLEKGLKDIKGPR
jgi:hypothetical protein